MKKQKSRYQPGQHPEYDHYLAHYRAKSAVLKPGSYMNQQTWSMSDRAGLVGLVGEYNGKLINCLALVDGVDDVFEERKMQRRRSGQTEPTEMPPDLLATKFKFEAWADVIQEEIAHLKELLGHFIVREKKEVEDRVLFYGPVGASHGEPTVEIDGQPCRVDEDGYPRIACKKSPYDGMLVVDYREKVSRPWRQALREEAAMAREKIADVTLPKAERDKYWSISQKAGRPVPWDELPPRPEGL
jgi:hypothetical protein